MFYIDRGGVVQFLNLSGMLVLAYKVLFMFRALGVIDVVKQILIFNQNILK